MLVLYLIYGNVSNEHEITNQHGNLLKPLKNELKYLALYSKTPQNTLIYINLERAVNTLEEACKLLEVGFEYVTDINDKKLFRKRK